MARTTDGLLPEIRSEGVAESVKPGQTPLARLRLLPFEQNLFAEPMILILEMGSYRAGQAKPHMYLNM
jgi:hypothetical protein